mmetsp:Transcript_57448/g.171382  ORF Transcript_57448/g.171382 Transcript_57448/m.171382 type:complete len:152 (-) Transcript_57448:129-584(-)
MLTQLLLALPPPTFLRHTQSALDLHSTFPSSTTKFSTAQTERVILPSKHSTMLSRNLIPLTRRVTRIQHSSCSSCETTLLSGHQTTQLKVAKEVRVRQQQARRAMPTRPRDKNGHPLRRVEILHPHTGDTYNSSAHDSERARPLLPVLFAN